MRKGILFSLLCLIAIVSVACGSGNNAAGNKTGNAPGNGAADGAADGATDGGDADADPMAFYKKAGNSYMTKTTSKMGDTETVSYMKIEIVKSDDKGYVSKMWTYDKDKKETYSAENPMVEWPKPVADTGGTPVKVETTEETIKVEAGEFKTTKTTMDTAGTKTTTWMAKEYPGLMVKSESSGEIAGVGKTSTVTELVEYKYVK
jgi:hypothetical protein